METTTDNLDDLENGFIRAALASRLFPKRPFPDPPEDLDWERLYALLVQNSVAEHFYVLGKSQRDSWPVSFRDRLRFSRYGLILYGDHFAGRIRIVLSAFLEANIPVIVLKGWALIQTIYGGDYGQRVYSDIDILVHPKDADASEVILKKLGWQGGEERRPGYARRYFNAQAYFFEEQLETMKNIFSIGFHWGLLHHPSYNPEQISIDSIFQDSHTLEVAGIPVLETSVEDHLVYSCAHIVLQHRFVQALLPYYEIGVVIRQANLVLDWHKVVERAKCWKLILPLKKVMKRVEELWPGAVPESGFTLIEGLGPALSERFIHTWYEKTNYNLNLEHFLTWLTMPGIKRRFFFILEEIFPNSDYMTKYFRPALGSFIPLLYVRRFFRVFGYLWKRKA